LTCTHKPAITSKEAQANQLKPASHVVNKPATNSNKQIDKTSGSSNKQSQASTQALATRQIYQQQTFYSQTSRDYQNTSSTTTAHPREETGHMHSKCNKLQTTKEA
jgi:hypothetical protein